MPTLSPFVTRAMSGRLPAKALDLTPIIDWKDEPPFVTRTTPPVTSVIDTPVTVESLCGRCGWLFTPREDRVKAGPRFYHSECLA